MKHSDLTSVSFDVAVNYLATTDIINIGNQSYTEFSLARTIQMTKISYCQLSSFVNCEGALKSLQGQSLCDNASL